MRDGIVLSLKDTCKVYNLSCSPLPTCNVQLTEQVTTTFKNTTEHPAQIFVVQPHHDLSPGHFVPTELWVGGQPRDKDWKTGHQNSFTLPSAPLQTLQSVAILPVFPGALNFLVSSLCLNHNVVFCTNPVWYTKTWLRRACLATSWHSYVYVKR